MTWAFPAPSDDGRARHLVRGLAMPALALPTTSGNEVNFAGLDGWTILFVYPWTGRPGLPNPPGWDDIPGAHGSTPEAEGFRNLYRAFEQMHVGVFGLSGQATDWQRELVERLGLPFAIASDAEGRLQRALNLPTFEAGGTSYLARLTLALHSGRIVRTFYPVHPPDAHPREVLAWLNELISRTRR
ncbi:MAG: peroxiredoxin [Hyphomicrobiaceae bacterium]